MEAGTGIRFGTLCVSGTVSGRFGTLISVSKRSGESGGWGRIRLG